jgi:diguanylate cyclase (GGDEF)-like protein/PAS domain S-box-containing protein
LPVADNTLNIAAALNHEDEKLDLPRRHDSRLYTELFVTSPIGMLLWNPASAEVLDTNEAFLEICGRDRTEILQHGIPEVLLLHVSALYQDAQLPAGTQLGPIEAVIQRKDGEERSVMVRGITVANDRGVPLVWWMIQDTSRRQSMALETQHRSRTDDLTGLCNRVEFLQQLGGALERRQATGDSMCVVLFLDLDRFKMINDTLGHSAGDLLLKEFSQRLRIAVSLSEVPFGRRATDLVARFGGDEFLILLTSVRSREDAQKVCEKIIQIGEEPYVLIGRQVFASVSVGVATADDAGTDVETMVRNADLAMYEAKRAGRSRFAFFDDDMHQRLSRQLMLEDGLREAIGTKRLHLFYQPIVDLQTGKIVSAEALLRWTHAKLGAIAPSEFIPIAEESGLMLPIGKWAIIEACRQFSQWQQTDPGRAPASISVNVARAQLGLNQGFVDFIVDTLRRFDMPAACLTLEITEQEITREPVAMCCIVDVLHRLGVKLAMDDFGTGAASMKLLRSYPFDMIKIDREYFLEAQYDRHVLAVLEATLSLIHNLDMTSIAERVEHLSEYNLLKGLHCQMAQGNWFSRPTDADFFLDSGHLTHWRL